jgi:hypothetical protein
MEILLPPLTSQISSASFASSPFFAFNTISFGELSKGRGVLTNIPNWSWCAIDERQGQGSHDGKVLELHVVFEVGLGIKFQNLVWMKIQVVLPRGVGQQMIYICLDTNKHAHPLSQV